MGILYRRLVLSHQCGIPDDVCIEVVPLAPFHNLNGRNPLRPVGRDILSYIVKLRFHFRLLKAVLRTDLTNDTVHRVIFEGFLHHVLDMCTWPFEAVQRSIQNRLSCRSIAIDSRDLLHRVLPFASRIVNMSYVALLAHEQHFLSAFHLLEILPLVIRKLFQNYLLDPIDVSSLDAVAQYLSDRRP